MYYHRRRRDRRWHDRSKSQRQHHCRYRRQSRHQIYTMVTRWWNRRSRRQLTRPWRPSGQIDQDSDPGSAAPAGQPSSAAGLPGGRQLSKTGASELGEVLKTSAVQQTVCGVHRRSYGCEACCWTCMDIFRVSGLVDLEV